MTVPNTPPRLAVDADGYVWRVYDDGVSWSMAPINPDNSPIPHPVTYYEPVEVGADGYTVELGGQIFTQAQWEAMQSYIECRRQVEALPDAATWTAPSPVAEPTDELREALAVLLAHERAGKLSAWGLADALLSGPLAPLLARLRTKGTDAALAATTQATVGVLTGHTTGCACETCEHLRFVRLPDVVEAVKALADELDREGTAYLFHGPHNWNRHITARIRRALDD